MRFYVSKLGALTDGATWGWPKRQKTPKCIYLGTSASLTAKIL